MIASDDSAIVRLGVYNLDYSDANKRLNIYLVSGLFLVFAIVFSAFSIKFLVADAQANYKNTAEDKLLRSVDLPPARYQYYLDLAAYSDDYGRDAMPLNQPRKVEIKKPPENQEVLINI